MNRTEGIRTANLCGGWRPFWFGWH